LSRHRRAESTETSISTVSSPIQPATRPDTVRHAASHTTK